MGNNQSTFNRYNRLAKPRTNTNSPRLATDPHDSKTSVGLHTQADIDAAIRISQEVKRTSSPEDFAALPNYLLRTCITVAAIRVLLVDEFNSPIPAFLGTLRVYDPVSVVHAFFVGPCTALYFASPTYPYKKILEGGLLFVWCRILLVASGPYFVLLCTSCYLLYLVFCKVHFGSVLDRGYHSQP